MEFLFTFAVYRKANNILSDFDAAVPRQMIRLLLFNIRLLLLMCILCNNATFSWIFPFSVDFMILYNQAGNN